MTFRALCGDSPDTLTTVARFLSLLELFREGAVAFDQVSPLGELTVRWTGDDDGETSRSTSSTALPPPARRRTPSRGGAAMTDQTSEDEAETLEVAVADLRPRSRRC
jgi:segregation and condensation protein A